jgi:hypothetical protein
VSVECYDLVLVDGELWELECAGLAREAELAVRRQRKALIGDRREALRYDQISETVERLVRTMAQKGYVEVLTASAVHAGVLDQPGHSWVQDATRLPVALPAAAEHIGRGGTVVVLCDPFAMGEAPLVEGSGSPTPAREVERITDDEGRLLRGGRARRALWERQLAAAREKDGSAIVPTAVSNTILTAGLRRFAGGDGRSVTSARVVYRDGSEGPRFTLGAAVLGELVPDDWPVLRFAMMSMRHNEMDPDVDGAWFRNRLLSRSTTEGQTDQLAYELSVQRLKQLLEEGPIVIDFHQTGLQPAVMGFYRAVTSVLAARPRSVVIRPRFHVPGQARQVDGRPWGVPA